MKKGWFITIEGGEGAGKSTLIRNLKQTLEGQGYPVTATREPGGVDLAERIRELLLDTSFGPMDGKTEALLYAAARRQHLLEKVIPALNDGHIVLCDRYLDSSLAYQGYARGIGFDEVLALNRFAIGDWMPHLTLLIDIDPEKGLSRIRSGRPDEMNRFDLESLSFHRMVREGYLEVLRRFPQRVAKIDGELSPDKMTQEALFVISRKLGLKLSTKNGFLL